MIVEGDAAFLHLDRDLATANRSTGGIMTIVLVKPAAVKTTMLSWLAWISPALRMLPPSAADETSTPLSRPEIDPLFSSETCFESDPKSMPSRVRLSIVPRSAMATVSRPRTPRENCNHPHVVAVHDRGVTTGHGDAASRLPAAAKVGRAHARRRH